MDDEIYINQVILEGSWYVVTKSSSTTIRNFLGRRVLRDYMVLYETGDFESIYELLKYPWDVEKTPTGEIYRITEDEELVPTSNPPLVYSEPLITPPTEIYVVIAKRWGGIDSHSYIVGTAMTKDSAIKISITEEFLRGGKYETEIMKSWIGSGIMVPVKTLSLK